MNKEMLGLGLRLVVVLLLVFVLHYLLFNFTTLGESTIALGYNLPVLYAMEFVFSICLLVALYGVKDLLPHSLGYIFLGFITLRLVASYIYISEGLNGGLANESFKINFLTVILIFLAADAYIAYNVLNKGVDSQKE